MSEMTDAERKYDELTEGDIIALYEGGASEEFLLMAQLDDGERNSVRENADDYLEHGRKRFGDFGTALWEGDIWKAMKRADGTNVQRMVDEFGLGYINAKCREQGRAGFKEGEGGRIVYK